MSKIRSTELKQLHAITMPSYKLNVKAEKLLQYL